MDTESDEEKIPTNLSREDKENLLADIKRKRLRRQEERKKMEYEELIN